ncbi:hypothetical protein [Microcoleus sp. herbarium2]
MKLKDITTTIALNPQDLGSIGRRQLTAVGWPRALSPGSWRGG